MKLHIDISGQIHQKNLNSALGVNREDGEWRSVFVKSKVKKEILREYKGQIVSLIEKIHCILIYYSIKDFLGRVDELIICRDINFRRLKRLLPLLFENNLENIRINQRESNGKKSLGHNIASGTKKHKRKATVTLNLEMIEDVLFNFKK
jgi:hypothetical protein